MKLKILVPVGLLALSHSLSTFLELDRGAVTLETPFSVLNDNNITGNVNKDSDTIFSVTPTLRYQRQARGNIDATLGVNFVRFEEFSNFDSEDIQGRINVGFPVTAGSPFSGGFNFSYVEDTRVDPHVNDRVALESTNLNLNGQYRLKQRLSARGSIGLNDRSSSNYSDTEDRNASLGVVFDDVWQDVGVTLDYRTRDLDTSGDVGIQRSGTEEAISVGLTGQLLPQSMFNRLEAFATLSFQKVDSAVTGNQRDSDVVGYNGRIAWSPRETTSLDFLFSKRVLTTIDDFTVENEQISLGISQQFSRLLAGQFLVSFQDVSYFGAIRADERMQISANFNYTLSRNWSVGTVFAYTDSESSNGIFDFNRFVVGLNSVFRF